MTDVTTAKASCVGARAVPVARAQRGDTRGRILDTALHLFVERGYAATSVRDIAERLDITKAAVHYHFSAKEQLVTALLEPMLTRLAATLDAHSPTRRQVPDPRGLLLGVRDVLVASGPLLSVLGNDPSLGTPNPELHLRFQALATRAAELLAGEGAGPERMLRAHCALGAFQSGWTACLAEGVAEPDQIRLDVVLAAALAALGHDEIPAPNLAA